MLLFEPRGKGVAPYLAEFFGAFFVALAQGCSLLNSSPAWGPTAVGFAVMMAMYAVNDVSGGYLNPAVTLAFGLSRRLAWVRMIGYLITQSSAGLLAGIAASLLRASVGKPDDDLSDSRNPEHMMVPTGRIPAVLVEAIYTGAICFVALSCMTAVHTSSDGRRLKIHFAALAVGFVSCAGGYAASGLSYGIFNPSSALGVAMLNQGPHFDFATAAMYILAQLSGAIGASMLFSALRPERYSETEAQELGKVLPPLHARLVTEFIGTAMIVLTAGLSNVPYEADAPPRQSTTTAVSSIALLPPTPTSWALGTMLASMAYCLCSVSGAHFNPAVTVAAACTRRGLQGTFDAALYIASQSAGGLAAGVACGLLRRERNGTLDDMRTLGPKHDYSWTSASVSEMVFTALYALVVLCTTTLTTSLRYPKALRAGSFQFGLALGFAMASASYALENISGGQLNPAAALGVASATFVRGGTSIALLWMPLLGYVLWELLGGALAAILFAWLHSLEYKEDPLLQP